jgi:hypothetical protein
VSRSPATAEHRQSYYGVDREPGHHPRHLLPLDLRLSSAKAARAPTHRFKTGLVSGSIGGGISGRSLCGTSGRHAGRSDVLPKAGFCDMS